MAPLEITEVVYGRTVNIDRYENVKFEFRAKVNPGQTSAIILAALKKLADQEEAKAHSEAQARRGG